MGIKFNEVSHSYKGVTKHEHYVAIKDINLEIDEKDEFIAIVGQTGSGKSTLLEHMNALLLPTSGTIELFDKIIYANKKNQQVNSVRKRIGLVFQFPEYQLFEETVLKDIMFGPKNFGVKEEEARKKAIKAATLVGLDEKTLQKSPFRLSGGQMRRVAIAGILAMESDILVLDEPTRGLDPKGSSEVMDIFYNIYSNEHKTICLITHDMNVVAKYATRVIVMRNGNKVFDDKKEKLFIDPNFKDFHLDYPDSIKTSMYLKEKTKIDLGMNVYTLEDMLKKLKGNKNG